MHHPTDRMAHATAFVTHVVVQWVEREIAQWVHREVLVCDDSRGMPNESYIYLTTTVITVTIVPLKGILVCVYKFNLHCNIYVM